VETLTLRGSAAEVGRAFGQRQAEEIGAELAQRLSRPHNFDNPYFRGNMRFMDREFPDFMAQLRAFGEAAGIEDFDQTYCLQVYNTGPGPTGCSALGVVLEHDGPALVCTNDGCSPADAGRLANGFCIAIVPDLRPHGFMGLCQRFSAVFHDGLNDAGLMVSGASGHPTFSPRDRAEGINLYFIVRLLLQHCADCAEVRQLLSTYRLSGIKGINGVAADADGNQLGFELESDTIAFRESDDGIMLEVNHWQHPDLQKQARAAHPDFWQGGYYYNSMNRVQHVASHQDQLKRGARVDQLVQFLFGTHAPGRILQFEGLNIRDWCTGCANVLTSRDRQMRVFAHPLAEERCDSVHYPIK
jgi:hypothetical protein